MRRDHRQAEAAYRTGHWDLASFSYTWTFTSLIVLRVWVYAKYIYEVYEVCILVIHLCLHAVVRQCNVYLLHVAYRYFSIFTIQISILYTADVCSITAIIVICQL